MIKNVVFDMGNVIIEWNPIKLSESISLEYATELRKYLFQSKTWAKLDAGELSLEEGIEEVLNNSPKEYHEILTYAFYNWGNHFGLLENTHELMKKLKAKGYRLYMLSNCSVMFDVYHKQYEVFELLEEKYVSAHRRLTKPSKEIYLDFLNLYQLKADECLFIDDVEANVLGARSVGMQAYHFTGDINELEEILL